MREKLTHTCLRSSKESWQSWKSSQKRTWIWWALFWSHLFVVPALLAQLHFAERLFLFAWLLQFLGLYLEFMFCFLGWNKLIKWSHINNNIKWIILLYPVLFSRIIWLDWRETMSSCHSTLWTTWSRLSVRFPQQYVRTESGSSLMMSTPRCCRGTTTQPVPLRMTYLLSRLPLICWHTCWFLQCLVRRQCDFSRWWRDTKEHFRPDRQRSGYERIWCAVSCSVVHRPQDSCGKDVLLSLIEMI